MSEILLNELLQKSEMAKGDLDFICDLLDKRNPQKVVEVGVAAGGTSVAILDKLNRLQNHAEMYSLDKSEEYYCDKTKKTGYLIDYYKRKRQSQVHHELWTGRYAVEFLDKIGRGIDFLILDTVHCLPGELLDFLAFLPYLEKDAVVILHDIILNHLSDCSEGYATQVLMDCVVANKLTPIMIGNEYPGIGAFQINEDTYQYIDNVFNALMITWNYLPPDNEIKQYRNFYKKYYSELQLFIFDQAYYFNKSTLNKVKDSKRNSIDNFVVLSQFVKQFKENKVYIYGNGMYGQLFNRLFKESGIVVKGFITTRGDCDEDDTISLDSFAQSRELEEKGNILIIGVSRDKQQEIVRELSAVGIEKYIRPTEAVLSALM